MTRPLYRYRIGDRVRVNMPRICVDGRVGLVDERRRDEKVGRVYRVCFPDQPEEAGLRWLVLTEGELA